MKKKISLLIMCILSIFLSIDSIYAKQVIKLKECEYTEEFKEYMKLSDEEKTKVIMPMMCKTYSNVISSLKGSSTLGNITDEKFDLRKIDKVTSIKNQSFTESCWAFATNASLESNLLVNGYGEYNLSEAHMELATQNKFKTPYKKINRYFNMGGHAGVSASYLLNYWGPIDDKDMPINIIEDLIKTYATDLDSVGMDKFDVVVDVNSVNFITPDENEVCGKNSASTQEMKKYLVNNGAIYSGYYHYNDGKKPKYDCDETTKECIRKHPYINGSYYFYNANAIDDANVDANTGTIKVLAGNHAITIVGWDDTISKENFNSNAQPTEDGAWIVKNSWGISNEIKIDGNPYTEIMGDDGYYYISYEDLNICKTAVSFNADNKKSDNLYSYDYIDNPSATMLIKNTEKIYLAAVYNKKTDDEEIIDKIILSDVGRSNQTYKVYYLEGSILDQNLEDAVLISEGSFKMGNVAFNTIELNENILVDEEFSVIIVYEKDPNSNEIYIPSTYKMFKNYFVDSFEVPDNVTFVSYDGNSWGDTSEDNFTPVLKVYTNNVGDGDVVTTTKKTTKKEETTTSKKEETTTKKKEEVKIEIEENEKNEESYIDTTPSNKVNKESNEKNPSTSDTNILGIISILLVLGALIPFSIKKVVKK